MPGTDRAPWGVGERWASGSWEMKMLAIQTPGSPREEKEAVVPDSCVL